VGICGCSLWGHAHVRSMKREHARVCTHGTCRRHAYNSYLFSFIRVPPLQDRCWGNPQNQNWSFTIITAILIKVSHSDPLIFSQCWLHCSAVTTSITKLQPVINLHIIYMSSNQHTVNTNPKIIPVRTLKPLPVTNHPPILIWHEVDAISCILYEQSLVCLTKNYPG